MNSFQKGARAERAWAGKLCEAGYDARRGRQFAGGPESPDVACSSLELFHFEVKHCERPNPFAFFAQAARDAGAGKIPVVAMKRDGTPFLIVMHSADFLMLLNAGALAELSGAQKTKAAENKNARAVETDTSSSGEHLPFIPTAAQLQGQRDPHLQITKLVLRLTKSEARVLIEDLLQRYPGLREVVSATENEVEE